MSAGPFPSSEEARARALALAHGLDYVDLDASGIGGAGGPVIPAALARRAHAVTVGIRGGCPTIAVSAPDDVIALDDIRLSVGQDVVIVVAQRTQIDRYLDSHYGETIEEETPKVLVAAAAAANEVAGQRSPRSEGRDPSILGRADLEALGGSGRASLDSALIASGQVTNKDMELARLQSAASGRTLREVIADLGLVNADVLQRAVAAEAGLEFVDLNRWVIDHAASDLVPESLARRYHLLGIGFRGDRPIIAMADPSDVFALDDVRTVIGRDVAIVVSTARQIDEYIVHAYRGSAEADIAARTAAFSTAASETGLGTILNDLHAVVEDAPIVKFVNLILNQALNERASDVHIEPGANELTVRFRIDGVLHHVTSAPKAIQGGVTTRLKVMSDLDIAEHRVPQDGRMTIAAGKREIDLRVATLPTVHGEKVVLRVLDRSTAPLDLAKLGFLPDVLDRYEQSYKKSAGTLLVTGPTGSGKSTTLYATLSALNTPEKNLITVEDPVEYQLPGISQVQVNPKAGLSFANALRSILRSDPDVVLVGEIRDQETATIAIGLALTGHLVLSCLHTNDAASAPMRLIEMGVEPFLVCSALDCVLAQRLARMLCQNCAEPYEPPIHELRAAGWQDSDIPPGEKLAFRRPVGCQACGRTGYHGRVAIQEVMLLSEEIERGILARAQTEEIRRVAIFEGMRALRHDGLRKAALGMTSLEEMLRVVV